MPTFRAEVYMFAAWKQQQQKTVLVSVANLPVHDSYFVGIFSHSFKVILRIEVVYMGVAILVDRSC